MLLRKRYGIYKFFFPLFEKSGAKTFVKFGLAERFRRRLLRKLQRLLPKRTYMSKLTPSFYVNSLQLRCRRNLQTLCIGSSCVEAPTLAKLRVRLNVRAFRQ